MAREMEAATHELGNKTAEMPAVLISIMAFFVEKVGCHQPDVDRFSEDYSSTKP